MSSGFPTSYQPQLALDRHMKVLFNQSVLLTPPELGIGHKLCEVGDPWGFKRIEVVTPLQLGDKSGVYIGQYTDKQGRLQPFPNMGTSQIVFKLQNEFVTQTEYNSMKLFDGMPQHVARYHTTWGSKVMLVKEDLVVKNSDGEILTPNFNVGVWKILILDLHTPILSMNLPVSFGSKTQMIFKITHDLLLTLKEMAKQGIVYRDLKLDNVLWNDRDKRAVLGDLACAARYNHSDLIGHHEASTSIQGTNLTSISLVIGSYLDEVMAKMPKNYLINYTKKLHGLSAKGFTPQEDAGGLYRLINHMITSVCFYDGCAINEDFSGLLHEPHIDLFIDIRDYSPTEHAEQENYEWCIQIAGRLDSLIYDFEALSKGDNCIAGLKHAFPTIDPKLLQLVKGLYHLGEGNSTLDDALTFVEHEMASMSRNQNGPGSSSHFGSVTQSSPSASSLGGSLIGKVPGSSPHVDASLTRTGISSSVATGPGGLAVKAVSNPATPSHFSRPPTDWKSPVPSVQIPDKTSLHSRPLSSPHVAIKRDDRYITPGGKATTKSQWIKGPEEAPEHTAFMQFKYVQGKLIVTIPRVTGEKSTGYEGIFYYCPCGFLCGYVSGGANLIAHFTQPKSKFCKASFFCRRVTKDGKPEIPMMVFDEEVRFHNLEELQTGTTTDWDATRLVEVNAWYDSIEKKVEKKVSYTFSRGLLQVEGGLDDELAMNLAEDIHSFQPAGNSKVGTEKWLDQVAEGLIEVVEEYNRFCQGYTAVAKNIKGPPIGGLILTQVLEAYKGMRTIESVRETIVGILNSK